MIPIKSKYILGSVCIIFVVLLSVFLSKEETALDISKYTLSDTKAFQQEHYSKLLTDEERKIYEEICQRAQEYESGIIELDEPVELKQFYEIWDCVTLENSFFYVNHPMLFTAEDTVPKSMDEQDEYRKTVLIFAFSKEWEEAGYTEKDVELQAVENDLGVKAENLSEFVEDYVMYGKNAVGRFQNEEKQIEEELDEVAEQAPPTENLKDNLDYFQTYIYNNFEYDQEAEKELMENAFMGADEALYTRNVGCVLKKKATCAGFSRVFVELCKRKNIDAYVSLGTYTNVEGKQVGHAWVGIPLKDGSTIYVDPTKSAAYDEVTDYYSRQQLRKKGYRFDERCKEF